MKETGTFSHVDQAGRARMVDVSTKTATDREARATARVMVGEFVANALRQTGAIAKGNVLETARLAGIMAAKRTADLIPMCHPLPLHYVNVEIEILEAQVEVRSHVKTSGVTGVEMEALTAASVAALTVYDMCKSVSKGITIQSVRLLEKSGGKSGHWEAAP